MKLNRLHIFLIAACFVFFGVILPPAPAQKTDTATKSDESIGKETSLKIEEYLSTGKSLYRQDKFNEAIDVWQKALELDPQNSQAQRYIERAKERLQELQPAPAPGVPEKPPIKEEPKEVQKEKPSLPFEKIIPEIKLPAPSAVEGFPPIEKPARLLTLKQCIRIAIDNSLSITTSKKEVRLAKQKAKDAWRALFPAASIKAEWIDGTTTGEDFTGREYYLELQQPIYQGGRLINTLNQAKMNLKVARSNFEKLKNDLVYEVEQAFHILASTKKTHRELLELMTLAKKDYGVAEKESELQLQREIDFLNVKNLYQETEYKLLSNQKDLTLAYLTLYQTLNMDPKKQYIDIPEPPLPKILEINLEECQRIAINNRPDLSIKEFLYKFNKYGMEIALSQNRLKIDLTAGGGYKDEVFISEDIDLKPEWYVGVKGSIPLWLNTFEYQYIAQDKVPSAGQTTSTQFRSNTATLHLFDSTAYTSITEALVNLDKAKDELRKLEKSISFEVEQDYYEFEKAVYQLSNTSTKLRLGEVELAIVSAQRDLNMATTNDLLRTRIKLWEAKTGYHQAIAGYFTSVAKLNKTIGLSEYFDPMGEPDTKTSYYISPPPMDITTAKLELYPGAAEKLAYNKDLPQASYASSPRARGLDASLKTTPEEQGLTKTISEITTEPQQNFAPRESLTKEKISEEKEESERLAKIQKAEEKKKQEDEKQKLEQEKEQKRQEEQKKIEEEKRLSQIKKEEERKKQEEEKKKLVQEQEQKKLEEQKIKEEEKCLAQLKKEEERKLKEEAKRLEQLKKQEEKQKLAQEREQKRLEERKLKDEEKRLMQLKKEEEKRLAQLKKEEERKKREEEKQKLSQEREQKKLEEQKLKDEEKRLAQLKKEEERKIKEEAEQLAKIQREEEKKKQEEEKQKLTQEKEQKRLEERKLKEEEKRLAQLKKEEERKIKEEENKKQEEEKQKIAQEREHKRLEEQKLKEEQKYLAQLKKEEERKKKEEAKQLAKIQREEEKKKQEEEKQKLAQEKEQKRLEEQKLKEEQKYLAQLKKEEEKRLAQLKKEGERKIKEEARRLEQLKKEEERKKKEEEKQKLAQEREQKRLEEQAKKEEEKRLARLNKEEEKKKLLEDRERQMLDEQKKIADQIGKEQDKILAQLKEEEEERRKIQQQTAKEQKETVSPSQKEPIAVTKDKAEELRPITKTLDKPKTPAEEADEYSRAKTLATEIAKRKSEEQKIKQLPEQKRKEEEKRLAQLVKEQEKREKEEEKRLAQIKKQREKEIREAEKQKLSQEKERNRLAEQKRKEEEKRLTQIKKEQERKKAEEEKQKLALDREQRRLEEQKIKEEEKRLAQLKRDAERKRQDEEKRLAQLKKEEEKKKQDEERRLIQLKKEEEKKKQDEEKERLAKEMEERRQIEEQRRSDAQRLVQIKEEEEQKPTEKEVPLPEIKPTEYQLAMVKAQEKLAQLEKEKTLLMTKLEDRKNTQQKEIDEYLLQAEKYYQKQDYTNAVKGWAKALALSPANTEAQEGIKKTEEQLRKK